MINLDEDEVRSLFSEYLEGTLEPELRDKVQIFLAEHPQVASELIHYERTLAILHRLPPREPVLDMWSEVEPEVKRFRSEIRWSLKERIRNRWFNGIARMNEGITLYTHMLAERSYDRLRKHLQQSRLESHPMSESESES